MSSHLYRRGALALALWPLSLIYGLITSLWHAMFDLGLRTPTRIAGAKVISVGNLVVGGAGKTPVVLFLANEAIRRGAKVAILTRGYGRTSQQALHFDSRSLPEVREAGDEPRMLARRCPGATVYVGANRVASARAAVSDGANVVILDDGFQHRQLARDVDLLIDADQGNGFVLPAGPLRESASHRSRATHVWGRDGRAGDFEARHVVTQVRTPQGQLLPVSALKDQPVHLLLGVARPELVRTSVEGQGARVTGTSVFADHHLFTEEEREHAKGEAGTAWLLTTEKDAERLPQGFAHVLVLDVQLMKGDLDRLLEFPLPAGRG